MTPDLTAALAIQGFMDPPELHWLAEQAAAHRSIIEWGSSLGRSTVGMAANTKGHVWAIDDWAGVRDDGINTHVDQAIAEELVWPTFRKNTEAYPNITAIHFDHRSWSVLPIIADMVFIDGSHQYEHVWQDLYRFLTLHPRALLCGHDIDFPTVRQAVVELLPIYSVVEGTSIWYRCP